jgi:hypothetical protein
MCINTVITEELYVDNISQRIKMASKAFMQISIEENDYISKLTFIINLISFY